MPHNPTACQLPPSRKGVSSQISTLPGEEYTPVVGPAQEVEHTASRRTGPRRWLRAVTWLIAAGLHPRAGDTTLRVAEDLAERMDYDTGHVRYGLDDTAARLRVSVATVKRHTAVLRELGALAWVTHGTRTNVRRLLGLTGYAGTATVYAAVIPAVVDLAMGRTVIGTGYGARIVIDQRGQTPPAADPSTTLPAGAPDEGLAPPSLTSLIYGGKAEVESGCKDTSRKRATPRTAISPSTLASNSQARRSPAQVARDCWIAARVRPRVNWTQGESIRRLAYALRPLIDQGLDADTIAAELSSWWLSWRPSRPAAYIRVQLDKQAALDADRAAAVDPMSNPAWAAMCAQQEADAATLDVLAALLVRTDDDRRRARADACRDLRQVVQHMRDHGEEDAIDLYGINLACKAVHLDASPNIRIGLDW